MTSVEASGALLVDCRRPDQLWARGAGTLYFAMLEVAGLHGAVADRIGRSRLQSLAFPLPATTAPGPSAALQALMTAILRCAECGNSPVNLTFAAESILRAFVDLCLSSFPSNLRNELFLEPGAVVQPRHVRRALEFMRSNIACDISMDDVAKAVYTTRRSLEMGFKRSLGSTPAAHLRKLRLEGARAALLDPQQVRSVSEIAMRWGFSHMGMFARHYRDAFGELPSATLAHRP